MTARSKKEKKAEPTEDEKFVASLVAEVGSFMTLHRAAYFGQAKAVEKALADGAAGAGASVAGQPALPSPVTSPSSHGHKLAPRGHVDELDECGNSALILAARNGSLPAVTALLAAKASVDLAGHGGWTALHHACKNDHSEVVSLLLSTAKANPNLEDEGGNTPASLCARMGNLKVLELVVSAGGAVDHANKRGCTTLGTAVLNGRAAVVDWIVKQKVDVNHADKDGNTALHYAAKCGYIRLVRQLLAAKAKTATTNSADETAEDVSFTDAIRALIKNNGS